MVDKSGNSCSWRLGYEYRCCNRFVESFSRVGDYSKTGVRDISELIVNKLLCLTTRRGIPKKGLLIQV